MGREVTRRYIDPLAQVWLDAARRIGLRVTRTPDTYASTDGRGTLAIAIDRELDPDDSLAQMIFHELCHSLVEGEQSFTAPDWGMDNTGPDHDWREHACLRVQWVLTGRHGLRTLFAPTTDFRTFWDGLSGDVLADRTDPCVQSAIAGLRRAEHPPWAPALTDALLATARIATEAARFAAPSRVAMPSQPPAAPHATAPQPPAPDLVPLWTAISPAPALHPTGLPARVAAGAPDATCVTCAWRYESRGRARCRQADTIARAPIGGAATANASAADRRIDDTWPACERFEIALDCQTCGACCRAAYHSVEVSPRDPVVKKQPQLIVKRETYLEVLRTGDRCAALHGGAIEASTTTRYHCAIYDDRPRTCRDFTLGSDHCLTARRRVSLSL